MLGPLNSVWTTCGLFARSCFARTQKSSRFAQWPKTLYSTAYRNCSLVKVLLLKKVQRSLSDLDKNFGRNDVLLFEHSGSKDRDSADENVCNKSCVDPIAHACLYSSTLFLLPASGTWDIEPLGEKLSAQQCSRSKTVYYVPWGGGGVQFSKRPRFGGQFWKSTKCDRGSKF